MGEAKRVNTFANTNRDGLKAFFAEATNLSGEGATIGVVFVWPTELLALILASAAGDRQASIILRAIAAVLARIDDTSQPSSLCATCDAEIRPGDPPGVIVVQFPYGHEHRDAAHAIGSACCAACGQLSEAELAHRLLAMIRKSFAPGASLVTLSEAGTA